MSVASNHLLELSLDEIVDRFIRRDSELLSDSLLSKDTVKDDRMKQLE